MTLFTIVTALLFGAPLAPIAVASSDAADTWNPTADYVIAGQDEPGYRAWVMADPSRMVQVKAFNDYLVSHGVGGVAPTWQLIRTASDWHKCGDQPFEVPPTDHWPNIVNALRYVGAFVEPLIGQVEPVSAYRNPHLNTCADGSARSTHLVGGGVDMVPLVPTTREQLIEKLCRLQVEKGWWNQVGLGIYKGVRFHIDTTRYRDWGAQGANGGWGCRAVIREGAMPFVEEPLEPVAQKR